MIPFGITLYFLILGAKYYRWHNLQFRQATGKHLQLVLMSLKPGEEIGLETHANSDQFFCFEGVVENASLMKPFIL